VLPSAGSTSSPALVPGELLHGPLGCPAGTGVLVLQRLAVRLSHAYTVVVARCDSGAGSPPSGVFVVAGNGAAASVRSTLVRPDAELQVQSLVRTAEGVQVTALAYSRPDVPRCCPDRTVTLAWTAVGDDFAPSG
jgi:hypothetical protein